MRLQGSGGTPFNHLHTDGLNNHWRFQARAAIEAMREPTEYMMQIGETRLDRGGVYLNWIQMIDAALKENA